MKVLRWCLVCCMLATGAAAQSLPSSPVSLAEGRVVLGGEASASMAPADTGFFNFSDYEHSTLRELRLGLSALVRATDRISLLGELRSENFEHVTPFALYARIRPFPARRLDIQIGRIPPTFGSWSRQVYGRDNPLIGTPLAYQYLTSLRADAVPGTPDELLRMRGRGWLTNFSFGNPAADRGVPLVTAFTWDTGVQVTTGWGILAFTGAITNGTISNPRVADDNSGKQLATRVTVTPATGLVLGTSYARGEFLASRVRTDLGLDPRQSFAQQAEGLDLEYSRDRWMIRSDAVLSDWQVPFVAISPEPVRLRALAAGIEGRYAFLPGAYAAARFEHLGFSRVASSAGGLIPWDAPITRVEAGGGYYLQRNVLARASVQYNSRDAGRVRRATLLAGQLLFWF